MQSEADDSRWMRRALRLASRGWGRTSPNPMVGAVVVKHGAAVGEGWHRQAGGPHAEVFALREAGTAARGATLYVTLEPCSSHGRTPPCTQAICEAGIARVVLATEDPNPRHRGRGSDLLRERGVAVDDGVERQRAQELNAAFFCWAQHHRPLVLLKLALTADGRIATRAGQSKWITGPVSRRRVQRLRQWADVIVVGGETIRRDDPQLLVRQPRRWPRQPLRVVVSRSGDLGSHPQVLEDGRAETRVVTFADEAAVLAFLRELGREGKVAVLLEGGGEVAATFLRAGLVDRVALFIAPVLLGGRGSRPAIGGPDPGALADGWRLQDARMRRSGEDFLLTGNLNDVHRYC